MSKQRQQELRKSIEQLESRRTKLASEKQALEARRNEIQEKRKDAEAKHLEACRREALGEANDHEKIEREISALTAKGTGLAQLIDEKSVEIATLGQRLEPVEVELNSLVKEEQREQLMAEIDGIFREGKQELKQLLTLEFSLGRRLDHLRTAYESDPPLKNRAYQHAHHLQQAHGGVYMDQVFDPQELEEIRKGI